MNSVGYRTPNNMIIVSDEFDFRGSVYTETFSKINVGSVVHGNVQEIEWRKLRDYSAQRRSAN
jgi:hypothetical protein